MKLDCSQTFLGWISLCVVLLHLTEVCQAGAETIVVLIAWKVPSYWDSEQLPTSFLHSLCRSLASSNRLGDYLFRYLKSPSKSCKSLKFSGASIKDAAFNFLLIKHQSFRFCASTKNGQSWDLKVNIFRFKLIFFSCRLSVVQFMFDVSLLLTSISSASPFIFSPGTHHYFTLTPKW